MTLYLRLFLQPKFDLLQFLYKEYLYTNSFPQLLVISYVSVNNNYSCMLFSHFSLPVLASYINLLATKTLAAETECLKCCFHGKCQLTISDSKLPPFTHL